MAQVRPPPLCGKTSHIYRAFFLFPRVSVGLGRAARDVFFGLIGFRCETRAARARAGRNCRTQAGTRALKLGWVSAAQCQGGWASNLAASCACGFAASACLRGRVVCGLAGGVGGWGDVPATRRRK